MSGCTSGVPLPCTCTSQTYTHVRYSARTGKLNVTAEGEIDDAKVLAAVEEAGYSAVRV